MYPQRVVAKNLERYTQVIPKSLRVGKLPSLGARTELFLHWVILRRNLINYIFTGPANPIVSLSPAVESPILVDFGWTPVLPGYREARLVDIPRPAVGPWKDAGFLGGRVLVDPVLHLNVNSGVQRKCLIDVN